MHMYCPELRLEVSANGYAGSPHLAAKNSKSMASSIDSGIGSLLNKPEIVGSWDGGKLRWARPPPSQRLRSPSKRQKDAAFTLYVRLYPQVSKAGNSIVIAAAIIAAIRLAREEKIEVSSPARNRPGPF